MKLYWLFYIRNKSKNKRYQYLSYFIPAHSNLLTSLSSLLCLFTRQPSLHSSYSLCNDITWGCNAFWGSDLKLHISYMDLM